MIGKYCINVGQFHLDIWCEDIEDIESLENIDKTGEYFPQLQDLKVKCQDFVEHLPRQLFEFLFGCHSNLKLVQYVAPLDWLNDRQIETMFDKFRKSLEMIIISNTSETSMDLGMLSVNYFVDRFPNLTILGNLRTWRSIDYFDQNSSNYFRAESELSQLKENARKRNWDIDFELENLDFLTQQ